MSAKGGHFEPIRSEARRRTRRAGVASRAERGELTTLKFGSNFFVNPDLRIMDDSKNYWDKKHLEYANEDWIDKPTIFAQFAVNHFPKGASILELGAGQDQDSRYFASLGFEVIATDFSVETLRLLNEKAEQEGYKIKTESVDLSKSLPYESESFDVVYSHPALHYFDYQITESLFKEIHRVVKPDGILAALFNTLEDPEIEDLEKSEEDLYKMPSGIVKRYFDTDSLEKFIDGKFEPIVLDAKGETYKDKIKTLIRFIGRKI